MRRNFLNIYALQHTINDLSDLRIFMQHHIFAVWDFMSLLKALQNNLTCTLVPWLPIGDADTRYLINEIVVGEESDIDQNGIRKSHFELYLDAMLQSGADTTQIQNFISELKANVAVKLALDNSSVAIAAKDFVNYTFKIIDSNKAHLQAAIFTFGREDLIPDMFLSIVRDLAKKFPQQISTFKYYLERHIEVDGNHHSNLAIKMTENLCKTDEQWQEATNAVKIALQLRINLWDAIYDQIIQKN